MNNKHEDWVNVEQLVNNAACTKHRNAVYHGAFRRIRNALTGKQGQLPRFNDLYAHGEVKQERDAGVQPISIEQIAGSMENCNSFDREFNPISGHNPDRWISFARILESNGELPTIRLVKVGENYFIVDGLHRISVAKAYRRAFIDAHVIELEMDYVQHHAIDRTQTVMGLQESVLLNGVYTVAVE